MNRSTSWIIIGAFAMIFCMIFGTIAKAGNINEVFNLPADGNWVKVQDGEVIQWSAIPSTDPMTRIDLISYVEEGKRTVYYLIRSACSDSTVSSAVIKPESQVGIGLDCDGNTVTRTVTVLDKVQQLPSAAAALLKR